jgi:PKD repeat protein
VGRYFINFSVQDNYEEMDWCCTIIEVKNINDPPITNTISYLIVDADETTTELENLTISFSTEKATDPDIIHGDILTYSWDFDSSDGILVDAVGQDAKWSYPKQGNYTVTLTVTDTGSPKLTNSTSIVIQVLAPKEKQPEPEEDDNETTEDTTKKDKDGGDEVAIWAWITTGIIILVIIIISTVGLITWKKRKNKSKEEIETSEAEALYPTMGYPVATTLPPGYPIQPAPYMAMPQEQWASAYGIQPVSYYPPTGVPVTMESNIPQDAQQVQTETTQQQTVTTEQTSDTASYDEETGPEEAKEQKNDNF